MSQRFDKNSPDVQNQVLKERRLFENIWLINGTVLLTFFLSEAKEIEISLNISDRDQRNAYFYNNLPRWEFDFTSFWSNHSITMNCGIQCSKALVLDGFQKSDRFVCQYTGDLVHSEELGKSKKQSNNSFIFEI
jgi:hypothetical protein